jgi:hypothetical protein
MEKAGLNENHKRRLAVAMAMVDAAAARILDLLDDKNSPKSMTVMKQSISAEERARLREAMKRLQPLALSFAHKHGLEQRSKDLRQMLVAELSQIWTTLENCRPRRMKGMGEIATAAAEPIERDLERMLQELEEIRQLLEPGARRSALL